MNPHGRLLVLSGALLASSAMQGVAADAAEVKIAKAPEPTKAEVVTAAAKGERMSVNDAMALTGTQAPSAALKKLKQTNSRYGYLPHVGAKQRAKEERRQAKAAAKRAST